MKILHLISQKPYHTGSGVYLKNIIAQMHEKNHEQAMVCGIEAGDSLDEYKKMARLYPIYFESEGIPFSVVGMSDVMPYKSQRYCDLSEKEYETLMKEMKKHIERAISDFKPDIIVSNHLWLQTAIAMDVSGDVPVVGICHGTCIRQFKKGSLKNDYIKKRISSLDSIFVLHEEQKEIVKTEYDVLEEGIRVIGSGYDSAIFNSRNRKRRTPPIRLIYAGKISKSKGVEYLIRAFDSLCLEMEDENSCEGMELLIAGSGHGREYEMIMERGKKCRAKIDFLGKLSQYELAERFRSSDIFILPSFYEGLPLVVVEALACGCKAITTKTPGIQSYLKSGWGKSEDVLYIDLPDMDDCGLPMESQLEKFERDIKECIMKMVSNLKSGSGNDMRLEGFTWESLALKIDDEIKKIYNGKQNYKEKQFQQLINLK